MAVPSSPLTETAMGRRAVLGAGLALATLRAWAAQDSAAEALLRKGGVVAAFRHALAPGTFDPPGFRLGDCGTQRNLSEEGREQARRTGVWFKERKLQPAKVLASPWCRCVDTATLAFAAPQAWPGAGLPAWRARDHRCGPSARIAPGAGCGIVAGRKFRGLVHPHVRAGRLAGGNTRSGEALILRADPGGKTEVLARLQVPG